MSRGSVAKVLSGVQPAPTAFATKGLTNGAIAILCAPTPGGCRPGMLGISISNMIPRRVRNLCHAKRAPGPGSRPCRLGILHSRIALGPRRPGHPIPKEARVVGKHIYLAQLMGRPQHLHARSTNSCVRTESTARRSNLPHTWAHCVLPEATESIDAHGPWSDKV